MERLGKLLHHLDPSQIIKQTQNPERTLKTRIRNGEKIYGFGGLSLSPVVFEILANSGFGCVMIDNEHGPGDFQFAQFALQVLRGSDCEGILRIPQNGASILKDPTPMKQALGVGPAGVVIPMVNTAEEAQGCVDAFRYATSRNGLRGAGWGAERGAMWGANKDYPKSYVEDTLLILMIESPLGVENISEIAKVDGVDALMVGPRDMTVSMGKLEKTDPEVLQMFHKFEHNTKQAMRENPNLRMFAGATVHNLKVSSDVPDMWKRGYSLVIGTNDTSIIRLGGLANVEQAQGKYVGTVNAMETC